MEEVWEGEGEGRESWSRAADNRLGFTDRPTKGSEKGGLRESSVEAEEEGLREG